MPFVLLSAALSVRPTRKLLSRAAMLMWTLAASGCGPTPQPLDLIPAAAPRAPEHSRPGAAALPCASSSPAPAERALVEASVAGRDRDWVRCQAGKQVRINDVVRRTLPATPPSRLGYRIDIPKGAKLSLSMGLQAGEQEAQPVEFVVKLSSGGREEIVFTQVVDPASRAAHRSWLHGQIDLSRFAGRDRHLILETRAFQHSSADALTAFWGDLSLTVAKDDSPLVIVYLVDTLRADHTTPYGYTRDTTPHLLNFARDGVVFEQAVSHASWTKPAVASVFTSLLPGRHGTVQLRDPLDAALVTLPEMLQARGYSTGAVVANSLIYSEGANFEQGFDFFAGLHGEGDRPSKLVNAAGVVDAALEFLDARRGLPTFLYIHTMDPHVPYAPPPPFDRKFEPHPTPGHPGVDPRQDYKETLDRERLIAQYDGDIAYGDQEFGRFVAALKSRGLFERALIVFTADHGEEFLDHGRWLHGLSLFDEVIRVPLIVKFPSQRAAGTRISEQVQHVDILPTVLHAANLPIPPSPIVTGRPLPAVRAGDAPERLAASEISHRGIVEYAVRSRGEKYIRQFSPEGGELYFDLHSDPTERTSRLDLAAPQIRRLRAATEEVMMANSFRHSLRIVGLSRYDLRLRTVGWFDAVESVGLGLKDKVEPRGGKLTLTVNPRAHQPRDITFVVRPAGARVWMEGTRDGRPIKPRDVLVAAEGLHPKILPVSFPETETDGGSADDIFTPPRAKTPGIHIWLEMPAAKRPPRMNRETRERLCALGYVACTGT
jgi:arylsulfatase A-like enzyme